jgi:hypothetical protein
VRSWEKKEKKSKEKKTTYEDFVLGEPSVAAWDHHRGRE